MASYWPWSISSSSMGLKRRAVEVAGDALENWSQQVAAEHGYRDPEHFVEVYGICSNC